MLLGLFGTAGSSSSPSRRAGCRFPDAGDSAKRDVLQHIGHVANYPRCVVSPRLRTARGQGPNAAEKAVG